MYDPGTGRWTSEDPIGFDAGDADLYRYVKNDPTGATDPTGEQLYALGGAAKDTLVQQLRANGIDSYAVELGNHTQQGAGQGLLYLILRGTKTLKADKYAHPEDVEDATNALGSLTANRLFFAVGTDRTNLDSTDLKPESLTPDQRLQVFALNLLHSGAAAKGSVGYTDFQQQSWTEAGLAAVAEEMVLQHGEEGRQLWAFGVQKGVRIEGDNGTLWRVPSNYSNGTIKLAEQRRAWPIHYATTVKEAAELLFQELKDHKEDIENWANQNYNDPSSSAQMSDHMTDPFTGEPMPLHDAGRGELARKFDGAKTEAAGQVRQLMWEYAGVGLNVKASAPAKAAAMEREVSVWSSSARNALRRGEQLEETTTAQGAAYKSIELGSRRFGGLPTLVVDDVEVFGKTTKVSVQPYQEFAQKVFGRDLPEGLTVRVVEGGMQTIEQNPRSVRAFVSADRRTLFIAKGAESNRVLLADELGHLVVCGDASNFHHKVSFRMLERAVKAGKISLTAEETTELQRAIQAASEGK
ncbi:MAG TPA: RHS repeat-associated core domain-containing protein [Gemmataceae bacterium]|nr:RHS repeat-associated core domain-containing protein [Gemmataceae bacterium]